MSCDQPPACYGTPSYVSVGQPASNFCQLYQQFRDQQINHHHVQPMACSTTTTTYANPMIVQHIPHVMQHVCQCSRCIQFGNGACQMYSDMGTNSFGHGRYYCEVTRGPYRDTCVCSTCTGSRRGSTAVSSDPHPAGCRCHHCMPTTMPPGFPVCHSCRISPCRCWQPQHVHVPAYSPCAPSTTTCHPMTPHIVCIRD